MWIIASSIIAVYFAVGVGFINGLYLSAVAVGYDEEPTLIDIIVCAVTWPSGVYIFSKSAKKARERKRNGKL